LNENWPLRRAGYHEGGDCQRHDNNGCDLLAPQSWFGSPQSPAELSQAEYDRQPSGQDKGLPARAMQKLGGGQVADAKRARDLGDRQILDGRLPERLPFAGAHPPQYGVEQLTVLNGLDRFVGGVCRGGERRQGQAESLTPAQ